MGKRISKGMHLKLHVLFGFVLHFTLLGSMTIAVPVIAGEVRKTEAAEALALEEFLEVPILTGSRTRIANEQIPISKTVIDREQIEMTPARNIYDLLEVYVPGAMWVNHWEGQHPGIRGIINERNYKFLLLVNGRVVNQKAHNGATAELGLWDLNDIEKIAVFRGPGSVTFGPGAIMGVINITTKNAKKHTGKHVHASYVSNYKSKGLGASFADTYKGVSCYAYGSVVSTAGSNNRVFQGLSYFDEKDEWITRYFSDYLEQPQYKVFLDLDFPYNISLESRYTTYSNHLNGFSISRVLSHGLYVDSLMMFVDENGFVRDTSVDSGAVTTGYGTAAHGRTTTQHIITENLSVQLKDEIKLGNFDISAYLAFDSENFRKTKSPLVNNKRDTLQDALQAEVRAEESSFYWNAAYFSETEIGGHIQVNWSPNEHIETALGFEATYNTWGAPWGESDRLMLMGDVIEMVNGKNSRYIEYGVLDTLGKELNVDYYFVDDGWSSNSYSAFAEFNWKIIPNLTLLASGRWDKDDFSPHLFSPRIALLSNIKDRHFIRLIGQQSQRMNTAEQLYKADLKQEDDKPELEPETLTGVELIYGLLATKRLNFSTSVFYNSIETIGWVENEDEEGNRYVSTNLLGTLKLGGFEGEISYNHKKFRIGLNHSFVKQHDFKLGKNKSLSGISYSDLNNTVTVPDSWGGGTATYQGYGNDLANWSNHATKLFSQIYVNSRLKFHLDGRIFWQWEGEKDGLQVFENVKYTGDSDAKYLEKKDLVIETLRADSLNAFGTDARLNIGAEFKATRNVRVSLYIQNLLKANGGRRYAYDWANGAKASRWITMTSWVDEPRTFGATVQFNW